MHKASCPRIVSLAAVALALALPTYLPGAGGPPAGWDVFDKAVFEMRSLDSASGTRYGIELGSHNDIRIEVDGPEGLKGTMLIVGGYYLATRGLDLVSGYEIDAPDEALLYLQLLINLLAAGSPEGPSAITSRRTVSVDEKQAGIQVATPSAGGDFSAPWSLRGDLSAAAEEVQFDLTFAWSASGAQGQPRMRLLGRWHGGKPNLVIPDDLSLQGWKVYTLRVPDALPLQEKVANIGELRKRPLQ